MTGIGIDIGGTKVAAGIVDHDGAILAHGRAPIVKDSHETIIESICVVVDDLLARAAERPSAIGVAVPGTVDRDQGIAVSAVNVGWKNLPLVALLARPVRPAGNHCQRCQRRRVGRVCVWLV